MLYDDTEISINRCKFQIRKVKVNDINETCSTRGGNENVSFWSENLGHLVDVGMGDKNNIKMGHLEMEFKGMEWTELAQNKVLWRDFAVTVMNHWILGIKVNLLTG